MKELLRSNRGFLLFLLLFGLIRTACADWNPIPSGSMPPRLLVASLPGDTVAMRGKQLVIKGAPVAYAAVSVTMEREGDRVLLRNEALPGHPHLLRWMMDRENAPDFGPVTVPPEHYVMLEDNRDNSADSRYFGFVPRERLNGRAGRILVSAAILDDWRPRLDGILMPLK